MEDLFSYDVSEVDLLYEDGQAVELPPKGIEREFINERWARFRARNVHENKNGMGNIEERYNEDDDESDDKTMMKIAMRSSSIKKKEQS